VAGDRRREGRLRDVIRRLEEARSRAPKGSDVTWPGPVADSGSPVLEGSSAKETGELLWRPLHPKDLGRTRPFRTAPPSRDEFESHLSEFLGSRQARRAGPLFRTQGVSVYLGGVAACQGVDLELNDGEIVAVVGPNGSGKTVLCDAVTGFVRPAEGRIYFAGRDVSALAAHQRARLGLVRTCARPELFRSMTVLDNLLVAQDGHMRGGFLACGLGLALSKHQDRVATAKAMEMLELLGVADLARRPVTGLAPGTARLVELARALACDPRLVVLDEPTAGLDVDERQRLSERIAMVCDELGVAVLVTDQDLPFVSTLADYVYVMESGRVVARGAPDEVEDDARVRAAFLRLAAPPPAAAGEH
jgi:branched-chain amino acid transport system ATP-binding protein